METQHIHQKVEELYDGRSEITKDSAFKKSLVPFSNTILTGLNEGKIRIAEKTKDEWVVNTWVQKAILLLFTIRELELSHFYSMCYDKIPLKFINYSASDFIKDKIRIVPGAIIRSGCYISPGVVAMPSFVNIGAFIGENTMLDTWSTVGSGAQVGKNVHLSGGAGLGGVLEPIGNNPTIIEDDCFIGARSEIVEGVIIKKGSVLSMGVFIGKSTKIYDRTTRTLIPQGEIPEYSVVVPGTIASAKHSEEQDLCQLGAAIIIKRVDAQTRSKTSINELLRN
ncbi:MAG: 2,3,4,5-tetrahydropyridine-2,6-dicarboxylate N-succinyltransferase [Methylacidiphilales bacterium]|nr:2,3,4,5-tetrahydropyridine-2,6-dicarboxylate N-succinyltransferase [Candidatus Methylacidiphilales bacterium]